MNSAPYLADFKGWTRSEVWALGCCYSEPKLRELWGKRRRLRIRDVCKLDIPAADRRWLLARAPWPVIEPAVRAIVDRALAHPGHYPLFARHAYDQAAMHAATGCPGKRPGARLDPCLSPYHACARAALAAGSGLAGSPAWLRELNQQIADFAALDPEPRKGAR